MAIHNTDDDEKALSPGVKKLGFLIFLGIPFVIVLIYFLIFLLETFGIIGSVKQ